MVYTKRDIDDLKKLYESLAPKKESKLCAYCGFQATDLEHIIPYSFLYGDERTKHDRVGIKKDILTWSCSECNSLAGDLVFDNFWEKKKYICERVIIRYKKLISSPLWTNDEIDELDGNLREYVMYNQLYIQALKTRVQNLMKPEIIENN